MRRPAPILSAVCLSLLLASPWAAPVVMGTELDEELASLRAPWFTGTLLSSRGSTLDRGHAVVEPYLYFTQYGGLYNDTWRLQSANNFRTIVQQNYLIYGLTDRIDLELAPQWLSNRSQGQSSTGFGDFPVALGFQALRGRPGSWVPAIRLWVQEMFPTGRFENLDPIKASVEATGGGSFATTFGAGVQNLFHLGGDHFLRYRFNLTHSLYMPVDVTGFNAYGGGFGTDGRVHPGSVTTLTAAAEYTLTRHWVLALDIGFQIIQATRFSGTPGIGPTGEPAVTGRGSGDVLSVAPAVEYLFNEHVGLIADPWFSVRGRNTSDFFGMVAAIYLYM